MSAFELPAPGTRRRWKIPLGSFAIGVAFVIVWGIGANSSIGFVVASPVRTVEVLWNGLFGVKPTMVQHAQSTFTSAAIGYALAIVVGVGGGIALGVSSYWRRVFEPLILSIYSVPKIILFPIFLMFLGIGLQSNVSMAFIHAVFPLLINVMAGVKEINPTYIKVGKAFRAGTRARVTKIYFPAVALSLVVGLRMAFSFSIIGTVLSELFASRVGMGRLIMDRYGVFDIPGMFAPLLLLFGVAFVGNMLFWTLEKRLRSVR